LHEVFATGIIPKLGKEYYEAYMALKGNLRDFSVTQLLNLINLARKTGTLTIEGPTEAACFVRAN
jgi:hypothetical protein